MKIKELIKKLEKLEKEFGNKEIYIINSKDEEETIEDIDVWFIDDGAVVEFSINTSPEEN